MPNTDACLGMLPRSEYQVNLVTLCYRKRPRKTNPPLVTSKVMRTKCFRTVQVGSYQGTLLRGQNRNHGILSRIARYSNSHVSKIFSKYCFHDLKLGTD